MSNRPTAPAGDELVYLVGHTPFQPFLDYMTTEPIDAQTCDRKQLSDEWRAAHRHIQKLQQLEPSYADNPPLRPIDVAMKGFLEEVYADSIYQQAFSYVPVEIALVELDRL